MPSALPHNAVHTHRNCCRTGLFLIVFGCLLWSMGCARLPPSVSGFTGRRIHVTMTFNDAMQPALYYYFLINKYGPTGTPTAHGPVPVLGLTPELNNSFGNGYATGSNSNSNGTINDLKDYGITDFVLFHQGIGLQNNIGLYHYTDDPNIQQYPFKPSNLLSYTLPSQFSDNPSASANTLQFDLYLSQLVTDTNDQTARNQEAQKIQYLQVNIVATDKIPITQENVFKQVDAFGDTSHPRSDQFLIMDVSHNMTYTSFDNVSTLQEPTGDVYPPGTTPQPSLDLISWRIDVIPN